MRDWFCASEAGTYVGRGLSFPEAGGTDSYESPDSGTVS